jgi:hypothetical protein
MGSFASSQNAAGKLLTLDESSDSERHLVLTERIVETR